MPLRNIELVKRDFEESQWQDVIKDSGEKDCSKYSSDFFAKAREAEAAEAERMKEVFNLLGGLTSMMLTSDSTTEPFRPVMVMKNSRSTILEDFSDHQLAILKEIVGEIEDPEMRARVADVLWSRNRDFDAATIAIDSYLESATILEDPGNWSRGFKRIERAFRIAVLLGKKAGLIDKVFKYIEAVLDKYKGEDPLFLSAKLMSLLLEYRQGDFEKYASLSKKAAKRAESEGNFYKARTYWEMKAKWHEIEKNTKRRKAALKNAAETYIKDAEAALKREKI